MEKSACADPGSPQRQQRRALQGLLRCVASPSHIIEPGACAALHNLEGHDLMDCKLAATTLALALVQLSLEASDIWPEVLLAIRVQI